MAFALDGSGGEKVYEEGKDLASRAASQRHLLTHEPTNPYSPTC